MNETVISWTAQNWITVFLMVILGSLIVGTIASVIANARKGRDSG